MSQADSATPALRPGDLVSARYRVERFLDRIGAEESYAVRAVEDGRPLLLKLLIWPGGTPELPQDELLDWKSGVQRLASFRHPSLSQTHALIPFDEEGRTCLLREPVELEGKTLPELLRSLGRPLRETEVQDLASQIGEALDAVHRLDLLHLVLSPRRIVVISDGDNWRVKLTDVGLYPKTLAARFAEPGYLAPEVLSGQACDPRSDQFSLAVILYELLAGQPAFVGAPDEPREVVVQRVLAEDPLPLLLSKRVELALQRALSRSRGVRFAHLRDFVAALGGSVSRFSPPTEGRVAALPRRPESTWPRLWLPMVQGALWAVCGLGLLLGARKLLFPKKPRTQPPQIVAAPSIETETPDAGSPLAPDAGMEVLLAKLPPLRSASDTPIAAKTATATTTKPTSPQIPKPQGPRPQQIRRDGGIGAGDELPPPPTVDTPDPAASVQVDVSSQDGKLTAVQESKLRACLRLVRRPAPPYRVVLENISGTLYVSPRGTSDEYQTSSDFRDCLKLQISGIVIPKVVTITGKAKVKTTP